MCEEFEGKVKWFKDAYGFIIRKSDNEEFFVHFSQIAGQSKGQKFLVKDQNVMFETIIDGKGRKQAANVRVITG